MIKVDRDVPLPPGRVRRGVIYPFATMQPGDSFAVPCGDEEPDAVVDRVKASASYHRRNNKDFSYVVRAVVEKDTEGKDQQRVRCWCLRREGA